MSRASDTEIVASFIITNGAGLSGLLLMISGGFFGLLCGLALFVVFVAGWWRAFGGNLLWRDVD